MGNEEGEWVDMQILSDEQIRALIEEPKPMPSGLEPLGAMSKRSQHYRKDFSFVCPTSGNEFIVIIRKSAINMLDFSVILGYKPSYIHEVFRLRRYNGKSHHHSNVLERGPRFYDFHIHTATERYQRQGGFEEDAFAEPTIRYQTIERAIQCLLDDCGFRPQIDTSPLFTNQPIP